MHRAYEAGQAALFDNPVGLLDAPLGLGPVLDAARGHVAVKGVCGEGQVLCIALHCKQLAA